MSDNKRLDILDIKLLKEFYEKEKWQYEIYYISPDFNYLGVSYHTLRNHLNKIVSMGFINKGKTIFPIYYEPINNDGAKRKAEKIINQYREVLKDERTG